MNNAIELQHVSKSYGRSQALTDLSVSIDEGTIFGLLGPNGAGKSTCVNICSTLLAADTGTVKLSGRDITMAFGELRRQIALMPQGKALDPMLSVEDNLRFYCKLKHLSGQDARDGIAQVTDLFELAPFVRKNVFALSGGQFRRAQLARTLLGKPAYMLLDEPTLGIDIQGKLEIWKALRSYAADRSCTMLITSNDLLEIEKTCDRVGFINEGRLLYLGPLPNSKVDSTVRFDCRLRKPFDGGVLTPPDGASVECSDNRTVSVMLPTCEAEQIIYVARIADTFGIESLSQQRVDLVELFNKYGGRKS